LTVVGLIPARSGSLRVPGKNLHPLAGHPLLAYTIAAALESDVFSAVLVSTEDPATAEVARRYGAEVPRLRPAALAGPTSRDIELVLDAMSDRDDDAFAILRPTSPFRTAETIRRAWRAFVAAGPEIDSIRAVELVKQHPGKMWVIEGPLMQPLLEQPDDDHPWHSTPYQALPAVYVQNSSLEIAHRDVLEGPRPSIAGRRIAPFVTEGHEGMAIDYPEDIAEAERLVRTRTASLPPIPARDSS
jgi:N-acylneuraminate cytidylyltransferase